MAIDRDNNRTPRSSDGNDRRKANDRPITEKEYQDLYNRIAALRETVTGRLSGELTQNPQIADAINSQIDDMLAAVVRADSLKPPPPDKGLAQLVGIGPEAASDLGQTRTPLGVEPYDETVASERINAVGDLYYIYQHERIGVFRVMTKLQELFRAGTIRLSGGSGAYALYQFDRREVLRYTRRDRLGAYRRIFGYGSATLPTGAQANADFHRMYTHFVNQVTLFWRDKRISDVIRERATDPSFGSIAIVRRSGLDLRNNLKWTSFGHLNVLRVEVMQLLDEAFRILDSDDIKRQFGADNAWDVIEEVLVQHFRERLVTSPRQRMAVAGRELLRWLAQPHILQMTQSQFEALLKNIAEYAEEWLTSAQAMGLAERRESGRVLPFNRSAPTPNRNTRSTAATGGRPRVPSETEFEFEV
jgi:hypothetical protein